VRFAQHVKAMRDHRSNSERVTAIRGKAVGALQIVGIATRRQRQ